MSDKRHPTEPLGTFRNTRELGKAIAYLRYDRIIDFLMGFIEGTEEQARNDRSKGRFMLHKALIEAVNAAHGLIGRFEHIFGVCGVPLRREIAEQPVSTAFSSSYRSLVDSEDETRL